MSGTGRFDELLSRWDEARTRGETLSAEDLCGDDPDLVDALRKALATRLADDTVGPGEVTGVQTHAPDVPDPFAEAGEGTEDLCGFLAPPLGPEEIGRLGAYRVVKLLGAGGMGAVFLAVDEQLGRSVAIKTLRPMLALGPSARKRFLREARAAAALSHDQVVPIYHVGEENGVPFLVMPFLQGVALDDRLKGEERLPVREVLRIGREIAEGLAEAHARGLVHRDIKPANVWLEAPRGRVKILDFGLARSADVNDPRLTTTGAVMGTPAYMPPEQASGQPVDHRGDLYSLGGVMYRMATGRPLFAGRTVLEVLAAVVRDEPEPPAKYAPDLPASLADLIARLLAKDPAARPQTAEAVVEAIAAVERELAAPLAPASEVSPPTPPPDPPSVKEVAPPPPAPMPTPKRPPRRWFAAAVALAALIGGGVVLSQVVIRLKNKDGTETRIVVLPTAKVVVEDRGKVTEFPARKPEPPEKKAAAPAPAPVAWVPGAVEGTLPGLFPRQARLPGLGRWQVETVAPRGNASRLSWGAAGQIALGDEYGLVRVYDARTLALTRLIPASPPAAIRGLAWDPAGASLAVANDDAAVLAWKADGTAVAFRGNASGTRAVAWSPDGKRLASAGRDGTVRTWAADGTAEPVLKGHEGEVLAVAWSPDGKRLASGGGDGTVRTWSADGAAGSIGKGHEGAVLSVAWAPDGGRLASGGDDRNLRFWSADGKAEAVLKGHTAAVTGIAWSPDGTRLLSGSRDATVRTWGADGEPVAVLPADSGVYGVAWSPDGGRIAATDHGPSLRLWQADGTPTLALRGQDVPRGGLSWDPGGDRLVVARDSSPGPGLVTVGADGRPGPALRVGDRRLTRAAWSPDGSRLATFGWERSQSRIALLDPDGGVALTLPGHQGQVSALAWSPDGRRLAVAFESPKQVRVWDADGTPGAVLATDAPMLCVAWDAAGRRLAAGGGDGKVRTWLADGSGASTRDGHDGPVDAVAWRPGGETLASGGRDGTLRLWEEGNRPARVVAVGGEVHALSWEPGGTRLASGDVSGSVRLWSASGEPLRTLADHDRPVMGLAWNPREEQVASVDAGAKVILWDAATGAPAWSAIPLGDDRAAVFSPSGELLHGDLGRVEKELVFAVEDDRGVLEMLAHPAFQRRVASARAAEPAVAAGEAIDFAAERRAAEWLLTRIGRGGGSFALKDAAGKPVAEVRGEDAKLPEQPFVVAEIRLPSAGVLDTGMRQLSGCRRLRAAVLSGNPGVTSRGLEALRGCKALQTLDVGGTGVGGGVVGLLPAWPELEVLGLDGCAKVDDDAVRPLPDRPGLRELRVGGTAISDAGLARIARHCPNLAAIHLGPGIRSLVALKPLRHLHTVGFGGDHLTDEGIAVLRDLPRLDRIALSSPPTDEVARRLEPLADQLVGLDIAASADRRGGLTAAARAAIARMPRLRELTLDRVEGAATDESLADLAALPALRTLTLRSVSGAARPDKAAGVAAFRRRRPDVSLTIDDQVYRAAVAWPERPDGGVAAWDLPADAPAPAYLPFTAAEAKRLQEAWAEYRKTPTAVTNSLGMELKLIPAGEFDLRLSRIDTDDRGQEAPIQRVRLDAPYYVGSTEVTRGQFRKFVEATGYRTIAETNGVGGVVDDGTGKWALDPAKTDWSWRNPGPYKPEDSEPVCLVTREDAQAFCEWLGRKEDVDYRLPTEAEWEFASRAGVAGIYAPAEDEAGVVARGWVCAVVNTPTPAGQSPLHPVGAKSANAFGLYDTIGNVWELCLGPAEQSRRALPGGYPWWVLGAPQMRRGGGWYEAAADSLTTHRRTLPRDLPYNCVGFRVLRAVPGPHTRPLRPLSAPRGRPLSPHALVSRPAPIAGLRSWSVESVASPVMRGIAWSPTGDRIATGDSEGTVRLWDRDLRLKAVLPGQEVGDLSLAFSPDGRLLASGNRGITTIRIWDVSTGTCLAALPDFAGWCWGLAWSPRGDRLAAAGTQLTVIDVKTGALRRVVEDGGSGGVAWSPDGGELATMDKGGRLRFWDADTLRPLASVDLRDGAGRPAYLNSVSWSPDGKRVVAGTRGLIYVCDATAHHLERTIADAALNGCWNQAWADGRRLVGLESAGLSVWDAVEGKRLTRVNIEGGTFSLAWSPDRKEIASAAPPHVLCIDPATGKELRRTTDRGLSGLGGAAFSPDGDEVATTIGNDLAFWDAAKGAPRRRSRIQINRIPIWSPRGDFLAGLAFNDNPAPLVLVDVRTGEEARGLGGDTGSIRAAAWAPDGATVAAAGTDRLIRVWEAATGRLVRSLAGHEGAISSLAWSPDGRRLSSLADDKSVRVWDPKAGALLATYMDFPEPPQGFHAVPGRGLAWDWDSRHLRVALRTSVVRLDAVTGAGSPPEEFNNGGYQVDSIAMAPDGESFLVREWYDWTFLRDRNGRRLLGDALGGYQQWHPDARRFLGTDVNDHEIKAYDVRASRRLGTLVPHLAGGDWVCIGPEGHWRGSDGAAEHLVYVAQHDDGSHATYTPAEFARKFGWKNDPSKARLIAPDPK